MTLLGEVWTNNCGVFIVESAFVMYYNWAARWHTVALVPIAPRWRRQGASVSGWTVIKVAYTPALNALQTSLIQYVTTFLGMPYHT